MARRTFAVGELLLGRYRVDTVLGTGGMAIVLGVTQLSDGLELAMKVLVSEEVEELDRVRFVREGSISSRLRSEHVARVLEVGELDGQSPYLVMEKLDGEDLGQLVERDGPQPVERVVSWALDVCEALSEAHRLGIVHRDVKPANLFLTKGRRAARIVKVLDFGISKLEAPEGKLTTSMSVFGSPAYMSPEQLLASGKVDLRTDVYSLGVVIYELLTARLPFEARSIAELGSAILRERPRPLSLVAPKVPMGVDRIVMRCLEKNPRDRFATMDELSDALVGTLVDPNEAPRTLAASHTPAHPVPPSPPDPVAPAKPPSTPPAIVAVGVASIVFILVLVATMVRFGRC